MHNLNMLVSMANVYSQVSLSMSMFDIFIEGQIAIVILGLWSPLDNQSSSWAVAEKCGCILHILFYSDNNIRQTLSINRN